ncbi:sialate O-acetylesterase [Haloferula sp.]|uniref:sialate O-acetylesterase n=1 Tax=Haloferula sp. TaxID=2497595 RepID=UPI00329E3726
MRSLLLPLLAIAASTSANADYTYVDATPANTTLNGDLIIVGPTLGSGGVNVTDNDNASNSDDAWTLRDFVGFEDDNYLETDTGSSAIDSENTPDLITNITLGAVGTYDLVVVFSKNSDRDVAAKIGSSPSSTFADGEIFREDNSFEADQSAATPEILFDGSYSNTRGTSAGAGYLGTVTTSTINETVSIYINGHDSETGTNQRTQYDGIGYQFIPPPTPKHRDVFLIAGQSNADGRGLNSELTGLLAPYAGIQSEVLIHYSNPAYDGTDQTLYKTWTPMRPGLSCAPGTSGDSLPRSTFGMEIGAATVLSQTYPNPAFIKVTRGGTALARVADDWYPPLPDPADVGQLYPELITSVQQALQELTDAGDTYTVHALFWHQGESDNNRQSTYAAVFANFVSALRRDLDLPNLRVIVGELGPGKPQSFRDIQWQNSREIRNASFVSSKNLTTSDEVTHFDTASVITFGLRLGETFIGQGTVIDFEEPEYTVSGLDRQNDFSADADIEVVATTISGEYPGGQAAGNTILSSDLYAERVGVLPLSGARAMEAELNPTQADSTLLVAGWEEDTNSNGAFDVSETGIGMGLGANGLFLLRSGGTDYPSTGFPYQSGHWYRLNASWTAPDISGVRQVSLTVRNLTTGTDLNGGSPVVVASITTSTPGHWLGIGLCVNRGLVDSIGVEGPGYAGWIENRYPTLLSDPEIDDDGDGLPNGFEYALGLDPTVPDPPGSAPAPGFEGNDFALTYPEISRAEDALIEVDSSTDLTNWDAVIGQPVSGAIRYAFPVTNESRLFFKSHLNPPPR